MEAFIEVFMNQNYISGMTMRRSDVLEEDFLSLERFSDNPFYIYYPHEWWCAILSQKGDYLMEPVVLIAERTYPVAEVGEKITLPSYSTYDARLEQLKGAVAFLHFFWGEDQIDCIGYGLRKIILKTAHLYKVARCRNYDCENYQEWVNQYARLCIEVINEFSFEEAQKINLMNVLQFCCQDLINYDAELSKLHRAGVLGGENEII
jgi:hypothetical protein